MINRHLIRLAGVLFALTAAITSAAAPENNKPAQPARPKVLILGDSISIGYTEPVRKN